MFISSKSLAAMVCLCSNDVNREVSTVGTSGKIYRPFTVGVSLHTQKDNLPELSQGQNKHQSLGMSLDRVCHYLSVEISADSNNKHYVECHVEYQEMKTTKLWHLSHGQTMRLKGKEAKAILQVPEGPQQPKWHSVLSQHPAFTTSPEQKTQLHLPHSSWLR